jgi:malonyl-CoA decarboxylase
VLMRLCAHYLLHVRRRRLAFDPVANFHLQNGASVWRLNWGADLSHNGLSSSFGMMVNYRYVLEDVHSNNQMYLMDGTVPSSQDIQLTAAGKVLVTDRNANVTYMLSWNETE